MHGYFFIWVIFVGCTKSEYDIIFLVTPFFGKLELCYGKNCKKILKIYEWQSLYISLFGPPMHWGPAQMSVRFTIPHILAINHSPFYGLFLLVLGFFCHSMNRFHTKCYPAWTEGRKQPLKPKIKHC